MFSGVEGCDGESGRLDDMDSSRLRRERMPCKQARRDVSGDGHETVSSSKQRSVRAVADAKNPDIDGRETRYNLRRCK
jgi:hypothetical protein